MRVADEDVRRWAVARGFGDEGQAVRMEVAVFVERVRAGRCDDVADVHAGIVDADQRKRSRDAVDAERRAGGDVDVGGVDEDRGGADGAGETGELAGVKERRSVRVCGCDIGYGQVAVREQGYRASGDRPDRGEIPVGADRDRSGDYELVEGEIARQAAD